MENNSLLVATVNFLLPITLAVLLTACGQDEGSSAEEVIEEPTVETYARVHTHLDLGLLCTDTISLYKDQYVMINSCKDYNDDGISKEEVERGSFIKTDSSIIFTPTESTCTAKGLESYKKAAYFTEESLVIAEVIYEYAGSSYLLVGNTIQGCWDGNDFTE